MAEDAEFEELSALARRLLTSWYAGDYEWWEVKSGTYNSLKASTVGGLAAHTHYIARPALDVLATGRVLGALPLVRTCLETAITAQWAHRTADGYAALIDEEFRQQGNFVTALRAARSEELRETGERMRIPAVRFGSSASARFQSICGDLAPNDVYVIYRYLSALTHATGEIVNQYHHWRANLQLAPVEESAAYWARYVARSLVWAGGAMDEITPGTPRRAELEEAARALGTTIDVPLSEAAVSREQAAREESSR